MANYIDKLRDKLNNYIFPITLTKAVYKENTSTTLDDLLTDKLDSSAYTASDILAKTKTVDGTGSGLDADLLDGKEASAFSLNSHVHALSNISDVTATAAEVNVLDGITANTSELNYTDGVTSNIQTQLNTKAPTASPVFTGTATAPTFSGALSGNATSASKAGLLTGVDTRSVNSAPSEYMSGGSLFVASISSKTEFKTISALSITSLTGTYCYLITHTPWTDSNGGYPIQVAYGNGYPCWRVGTSATTWGAWHSINSEGNADKLDGNDASAFALASHTHTVANIDGLQTALGNKVDDSQVLTNVPANAVFTDTVYTHPASHPPSIITQDSSNRFVTDAEKSMWNAKEPAITKNTAFNVNFDTIAADIKMNGTQSVGSLSTVARADHVHPTDTSRAASSHTHAESNITNLTTDLAAKASLASPAFTGVPTAPTASYGTNTMQLATTAFVQSALSAGGYGDMLKSVYDTNGDGIVDNAEKLNGHTVSEFAFVNTQNIYNGEQKFQNSSYCPTAMDNASGVGCAYKASRGAVNQEIVGQIIAPRTAASDSNYSISNAANVIKFQRIRSASAAAPTLADMGKVTSKGWEGGAVLSGTPTAPTASVGTNNTQIATTAFVQNAVSSSSGGTTIVVSASQPSSQATNDMWFAVV